MDMPGVNGVSLAVLQWFQIVLSALSLAGILFGVVKVLNRNNEEWRERERRFVAIEQEVSEMRREGKEIIAIGAQLARVEKEMERVRDRLDRFLDLHAVGQPHAEGD
jgi:biopolymer transport protein ExbB/TolQ